MPTSCKDQTCPVCKIGVLSCEQGLWSCSDEKCSVKDWSTLWLEKQMSGRPFWEILEEQGESEEPKFKMEARLCTPWMKTFWEGIEAGALDRMGEAGMPCKGLPEQVTGAIGVDNKGGLSYSVHFIHTDGVRIVAHEGPAGKLVASQAKFPGRFPGCFPIKTPGVEKAIYVFPTARDALKARFVWKAAGFGNFPAYSFSGFPLPPPFQGTERIIFANVGGKLAKPEVLSDALAFHADMVKISARIQVNVSGIRTLITDAGGTFPVPKPEKAPDMVPAGKTKDGNTIYRGADGYYLLPKNGNWPVKHTNFHAVPTLVYATNFPLHRNVMFSDLYVDGNCIAKDVAVSMEHKSPFIRLAHEAEARCPGSVPRFERNHVFASAEMDLSEAEKVSFPSRPCVCDAGIVFPSFRILETGFKPHPQLIPLLVRARENLDYAALRPEAATKEDMAEFARLLLSDNPQAELVSLGLCAWLHMCTASVMEVVHGRPVPALCFEMHSEQEQSLIPMTLLYKVFSGAAEPRNCSMRIRTNLKNAKEMLQQLPGIAFSKLPGFFVTELPGPGCKPPVNIMFSKTRSSGIYAITDSDLQYPLNSHGNMQCCVKATSEESLPEFDVGAIRRSVLHFLCKYMKNAKRIDPDTWMTSKPELAVYDSLLRAFVEVGIVLPPKERFRKYRI